MTYGMKGVWLEPPLSLLLTFPPVTISNDVSEEEESEEEGSEEEEAELCPILPAKKQGGRP